MNTTTTATTTTGPTCWCGAPATYRVPVDIAVTNPTTEMSDGMPATFSCDAHMDRDGYEALEAPATPEAPVLADDEQKAVEVLAATILADDSRDFLESLELVRPALRTTAWVALAGALEACPVHLSDVQSCEDDRLQDCAAGRRATDPPATFLAQVQRLGSWSTVAEGDTPREAASTRHLGDAMQRAGFRYSELAAHAVDLAGGHLLTADNGTAFRVIRKR